MQFEENLYANVVFRNKNASSYYCDYNVTLISEFTVIIIGIRQKMKVVIFIGFCFLYGLKLQKFIYENMVQ